MSTVQSTTTSLPHDWRRTILQEIRHVLETNQCCWAVTKAARCVALMRRASVDEAQSISTALENQPFGLSALHPIFSSITPLVLCKRWHKTHADSLHHLAGIKPQMLGEAALHTRVLASAFRTNHIKRFLGYLPSDAILRQQNPHLPVFSDS